MNVLLTNVPGPQMGLSSYIFPSYPPLGLAYLAAVLRRERHTPVIVDQEHQSFHCIEQAISAYRPRLIGVSASMPMLKAALQLAKRLRQLAPEALLVVGGPLTTPFAERLVSPGGYDVALNGEGEHVLMSLVELAQQTQRSKKLYEAIPGIVTHIDGEWLRTEAACPTENLDELPFPARDLLVRRSLYLSHPVDNGYGPATTVLASRGCRFNCSFCYQYPFKSFYRRPSPERVVEEIEGLMRQYGIRFVRFIDDLFTYDRERTLQLCERLQQRLPKLRWHCGTRIDQVDEELLRAMYTAGCRVINFGFESGDKDDLRRMAKGAKADPREVAELCHRIGLDVIGQFIIGFPWDTPESIERRIAFAKSLPLRAATFWPLIPMPGTRLYEQVLQQVGEFEWDYFEHTDCDSPGPLQNPVYSPPGMTRRQIRHAVRRAQFGFHLRPHILLPLLKETVTGWKQRI